MTEMARLVCLALGHKLDLVERVSERAARHQCLRCRREFGVLNDGQKMVLPWDQVAPLYAAHPEWKYGYGTPRNSVNPDKNGASQ